MDLKDMILVMENYKGTERNMLMTLEDYKKFVAIDDMSELADQMLLLGRTLAEGFTEYYRAANVTVFAKFCRDDGCLQNRNADRSMWNIIMKPSIISACVSMTEAICNFQE